MSKTVREVMTTPVVTVRPDTPFKRVVAMVRAAQAGAVPVTDDSGLVLGIVCERDLLAKKASLERHGGRRHGGRRYGGRRYGRRGKAGAAAAAGLMASPAVTVRAEATTGAAARLMYRRRIASLPVVDSRGRLIGIISQGDILDSFTGDDAEIRRAVVQDVITRDFLLDPHAFVVTVREGVVTLSGQPESDQVGRLLAAAVRRVEGVVSLHDQMCCPAGRSAARTLPLLGSPALGRAFAALGLAFR